MVAPAYGHLPSRLGQFHLIAATPFIPILGTFALFSAFTYRFAQIILSVPLWADCKFKSRLPSVVTTSQIKALSLAWIVETNVAVLCTIRGTFNFLQWQTVLQILHGRLRQSNSSGGTRMRSLPALYAGRGGTSCGITRSCRTG